MSYTVSLFHIVIGTHQRKMSINEKHKTELYKYIWGIIEKCNCKLICINGIPDHIHLLVDLNSTISIAQLVRDIKRSQVYGLNHQNIFHYSMAGEKNMQHFLVVKV